MKRFLSILILAIFGIIPAASWPGMPMPKLHVEGRWLIDEDGNKVNLHGFGQTYSPWYNEMGSKWTNYDVDGCLKYNQEIIDRILDAGWKMTYVRMHMDPYWSNTPGLSISEDDISAFDISRFQKYLDEVFIPMAEYAISKGLYVVMRPPGSCPEKIEVDGEYHNYLKTVWTYVSSLKRLTDNPHVMFELANEPIQIKGTDGDYGAGTDECSEALTIFFQEIVDLMRDNGCKNILWVPGLSCQSQYAGFAKYPIKGDNIGYAVHVYPGVYGSDSIDTSQESDVDYDGGYGAFASGWKNQISPCAAIAPMLVTEMDWLPSKYQSSWGKSITGQMLGAGFGANFKLLADCTGNMGWSIFTAADILASFDGVAGSDGNYTMYNDPEGCIWPTYHWYEEYAGSEMPTVKDVGLYLSPRGDKISDENVMQTGNSKRAALIADRGLGFDFNIDGDIDVRVTDSDIIEWDGGSFKAKRPGETTCEISYTLEGKREQKSVKFVSNPFPLLKEYFNPSIWETGTFNEATREIMTGRYGFGGWHYAGGLDCSEYNYLICEVENPAGGLSLRIFDNDNYWDDPYMKDFGNSTRVVVDLNDMNSGTNDRKVDPSHIYLVGFWSFGDQEFRVKSISLSNDPDAAEVEDTKEFEYEGIWYTVIDAEAKTVKTKEGDWNNGELAAGNSVAGDIIIPSTVSNGLTDYTVVEIGQRSFFNNTGMTSVSVPQSVKIIEVSAFEGCNGLTKAQFASLEALCGINFRSTLSNPLYYAHHLFLGEEEVTEIVLPEYMTEVGAYTFAGGNYLTSVTMPNGLISIGTQAFHECLNLTSIELPTSLTSIGFGAFEVCRRLTSINVPEKVTTIGEYAFYDCAAVTSVTIPESVTEIGAYAFSMCDNLISVTYNAVTPIEAHETIFSSSNDIVCENATLSTPNATLAAVQATVPWSLFKKVVASDGEIGFGESVEAGEVFEFEGVYYSVLNPDDKACSAIRADIDENFIEIRDEVPYKDYLFAVVGIGDQAFSGKNLVETVSLPSSIASIGSGVFEGCGRLSSLIWRGSEAMPNTLMESVDNPNVIVYVDDVLFAPAGFDRNVVANGVCENLVLVPGYPFYPAIDFTAEKSSLTREFTQQTPVDGCSGWETIVLPFDVAKVTGPDGKTVIPFAAATDTKRQRPFWLYEGDPAGDWKEAAEMKAGVPYIISMPNNPCYNPAYNISGEVTFANSNPQKITAAKPDTVIWTTGRQFRGLWMPLSTGEAEGALGLNVNATVVENGHEYAPGSAFVAGVTLKPFEAYVTRNGEARAFPIRGAENAVQTLVSDSDGLTITKEGSVVILRSDADRTVDIHSADGTLLRRVTLKAGQAAYVESLPQGILLIVGRKIMVD